MDRSVPSPGHESGQGLAREFADLALTLQAEADRRGTLETVCELAVKVIRADHASITVREGGTFRTIATTSDLPEAVDRIQSETGEGPCVDADVGFDTFATGDLSADVRWATFGRRAVEETGVRSMLSHRLFVREGTLGFLNIYAAHVAALSRDDEQRSEIFAAHAAIAVRAAEDLERAENLEIALRTSRRIGTAIGILMHSHQVGEQDAFELLRRHSQDSNRKLVDVAEDVVYSGSL